jgi:hypothetical protein
MLQEILTYVIVAGAVLFVLYSIFAAVLKTNIGCPKDCHCQLKDIKKICKK